MGIPRSSARDRPQLVRWILTSGVKFMGHHKNSGNTINPILMQYLSNMKNSCKKMHEEKIETF